MNITESILTALDSLLANKLRALLTMLGVIIGVAAVIALLSVGNGVQTSITGEIEAIGTNLINITTDFDNSDGYLSLTMADMAALANPLNVPAVSQVTAVVQGTQEVIYGSTASRVSVSGILPQHFTINNLDNYAAGSGLTQADIDTHARVTVLGSAITTDLFGEVFPIGESVKINGVSYEVVGVLEPSGSAFLSADNTVFIPLTTAQSRLYTQRTRSGEKAVNSLIAQAATSEQTDLALTQITETLRRQHDIAYTAEDDFELLSQGSLLDTVNTITATLTAFLGAIAGISLLVGGIGIMNIMLVSVTERTREIGIRKAVGALQRDILAQFLVESVMLSVLGGLLGILLGWAVSQLVSGMLDMAVVMDSSTVLLATGFAAGVGLVFGVYPAWRASSLRPIEALRYE